MVNKSIIVIGVGNEFRCDDGVGRMAVKKLAEHKRAVASGGATALSDVTLVESSGEGAAMMDLWQNYCEVIIIDAAAAISHPGTIHQIVVTEGSLPPDFKFYSTHDFSVAETIELARVLDRLPAKLTVFAVEGVNFNYGNKLSAPVQSALEPLVKMVLKELDSTE